MSTSTDQSGPPPIALDPRTVNVEPPASDSAPQAAPAPDASSLPPTTQQAPPSPAAGAAPPPLGSKWASVIKGALGGLLNGGIEGAIHPAQAKQQAQNIQTEKNAKAEQAQANVRFTTAQAASLMSETAMRQIQMEHLPQQYREETQKNDLETSKFLLSIGAQPTVTSADATPAAFQAGLKTANDAGGGVPPLGTLHVGTHLLSWNLDDLGNNTGILPRINDMLVAQGQKPLDTATFMNKNLLPPASKTKMVSSALTYFNPTPEVDPDKLKVQTSQYQGALKNVQGLPDSTPHKDTMVADLTAAVKKLQAAPSAQGPTEKEKSQIRVGSAIAATRGAAFNNSKILPVLDEEGNLTFARAGDALNRGIAPAAEGAKANSKQAQLGDIKAGLDKVREDTGKLDTPFSPSQVTQLTLAMHSTDPGVIKTNIDALNNQNLTSEQKQFVVDVAQLHERALSMRSIAGMGQGSESMRAAIVRMLPSAGSGDREMMTKQLDAMDNQVQILGKGIPHVKGGNAGATSGSAPAPKVGDMVNYLGHPHKVKAVDAKTGKLTLGD